VTEVRGDAQAKLDAWHAPACSQTLCCEKQQQLLLLLLLLLLHRQQCQTTACLLCMGDVKSRIASAFCKRRTPLSKWCHLTSSHAMCICVLWLLPFKDVL
jgi:hypothetical protein